MADSDFTAVDVSILNHFTYSENFSSAPEYPQDSNLVYSDKALTFDGQQLTAQGSELKSSGEVGKTSAGTEIWYNIDQIITPVSVVEGSLPQLPGPTYSEVGYSLDRPSDYDFYTYQVVDVPNADIAGPTPPSDQLNAILGSPASTPITDVPSIPDDTGYVKLDSLASWWNTDGLDYANGNISSLLETEAQLFPSQQNVLNLDSIYVNIGDLSSTSENPILFGDHNYIGDIDSYIASSDGLLNDLFQASLGNYPDIAGARSDFNQLAALTANFDVSTLENFENDALNNVSGTLQELPSFQNQTQLFNLTNALADLLAARDEALPPSAQTWGPLDKAATLTTGIISVVEGYEAFNDPNANTAQMAKGLGDVASGSSNILGVIGVGGASAVGTAFSNLLQIGVAYEGNDSAALATALSKGAIVGACTAIGYLTGGVTGSDTGASAGQAIADAAQNIGDFTSNQLGDFLDNNPQYLNAYNNNGVRGLTNTALTDVLNLLPHQDQIDFRQFAASQNLNGVQRLNAGLAYAATLASGVH